MAKTFDLADPQQHQDYLAESLFQWCMYGEVWLTLGESGTVTVWEPGEVPPARVTVTD